MPKKRPHRLRVVVGDFFVIERYVVFVGTPIERSGVMGFTHLDDKGRISMVDVAGKATARVAVARGSITMSRDIQCGYEPGGQGQCAGDGKIAAIMAAKTTANTIPRTLFPSTR